MSHIRPVSNQFPLRSAGLPPIRGHLRRGCREYSQAKLLFAAGDQLPRLESVVEIQVHEKGGLFGTERTVVVDDAWVTVTEDGTTARQSLTPGARSQLLDAIGRVMSDQHPVQAQDVEMYDAAQMTISLQHADRTRTLTIRGADEPSESVLDLLELIDAASETGV